MTDQIFHDSDADRTFRAKRFSGRFFIYGILILWAIVALFPIYWTITTSFKMAPDVMKGNIIPYWDYTPKWLGWRSLGLSPDTIGNESTVRAEFLKRFWNSAIIAVSASVLAVGLGSCAAYGLSRFNYKFGFMRNSDISFFFLSQLILPPVVLALPFLVLYKALGMLRRFKPDLIFLDITMPELDGYQTCTLIRNAEDTRSTPVVMLSSSDGIFDIAKGQARGATAHVTKIPPENILRELIYNHTARKAAA